jgi:hypothetical protein
VWKTAYTHAPLMLAHDRRVLDVPLDVPLEERLQLRSVRDARAQLQTGHQDIVSYFSNATVATTDHAATIPPAPPGHSAALSERTNQDVPDFL